MDRTIINFNDVFYTTARYNQRTWKNKEYAFYGILNSLIMLFAEIIGLVVLKLGVEALIISKVLAYIVCIIFMIAKILK